MTATIDVFKVSAELQVLQRHRAIVVKSRIMQSNRLQAIVAGSIGYESRMPEKQRLKLFKDAATVIRNIVDGDATSPLRNVILVTMVGIDAFNDQDHEIKRAQIKLVKELPVSEWAVRPEQRGFGLQSLATVVGETGDLANYPNPAKLWRRMGCAPHEFDGNRRMGSTWRFGKEGKLPSSEWESFGYSPRRRSVMYVIGENLVKQNGSIGGGPVPETVLNGASDDDAVRADEHCRDTDGSRVGPYRVRYDEAKAKLAAEHVGNPLYPPMRCHKHGMLLATKLLLKNLWVEWHSEQQP